MNKLYGGLTIAALAILLGPSTSHAQFFGGPSYYSYSPYAAGFGGAGYGGFGGYGGYGGYTPYGYGGFSPYGYGGFGGSVMGPQYTYSGAVIPSFVYSVSTPSNYSYEPRMRAHEYPAIPYRAAPVENYHAVIDVQVPASNAQVWFDGTPTQQTGTARRFLTPPLSPGTIYTFDVRTSWRDANGKEQSRSRRIDILAGEEQSVNFNAAP